ncbi:MAG: hypothetical protein R3E50_03060 [Halioglobus sp.]
MHAILVNGERRSIEPVEIKSKAEIARLVGQESIIADEIDENDAVYFDEDCFIRGSAGKFQIDTLPPIAGKAVIIGLREGDQLTDVTLTADALTSRITFL